MPDLKLRTLAFAYILNMFAAPAYARLYDPNFLKGCGLCEERGDYEHGIALVTRAIDAKHDVEYALAQRSRYYFLSKQYAKALDDANAALKFNKHNLRALREKARAATELKKYDEAMQAIQQMLADDPIDCQAHFAKGRLYQDMGKTALSQAEVKLSTASQRSHYADFQQALNCIRNEQYQPAIDALTRYLKQRPADSQAYHQRAFCYLSLHQENKALSDFQMREKLEPDFFDRYSEYPQLLERLGRNKEALALYSKMTRFFPGLDLSWVNRGNFYAHTGALHDAVDDYTNELTMRPDDDEALRRRAKVLIRLGQSEKALIDLNRAIESDPVIEENYRLRISVLDQLGRKQDADKDRHKLADFKNARYDRITTPTHE